jgi:hypothetical protein
MTQITSLPQPLQRDFPTEANDVSVALQSKATANVLANNGKGAPPLRSQARKAADPYHKRTPVEGISPTGTSAPRASSSSSESTIGSSASATPAPKIQSTVEDNWGHSRMTTTRQSTIDYFLLRMIICCALAFSLLDNGFFIDFCLALYVRWSCNIYI